MLQTLKTRIPLVTTLLLGACEAHDLEDAPDRGALEEAIDVRTFGSYSGGGSTRLNTSMLFPEGMPLRHFARNGTQVVYDDAAGTRVTFLSVRLVIGGGLVTFSPLSNTIESPQGRLKINATIFEPGQLLGSEWNFQLSDTTLGPRTVTLRVTGVAIATVPGGGQVPLYNFSLAGAASAFYPAGPFSTCDVLDSLTAGQVNYKLAGQTPSGLINAFKTEYAAVLYGGVKVSELGVVGTDDTSISLACTSGAIGKSALWGYPSWVSAYGGMTGLQQLQAASRAIRADYCGDGVSRTADGTPLQIRDRYTAAFDDPTEATEAVWGANGSRCTVTDDRLGTGLVFPCGGAVATTDCNQLGSDWITGPDSFMWTKVDPARTTVTPKTACNVAAATPGCADPGIQAVVCDVAPDCCTIAWDSLCVTKAATLGATGDACCIDNGGPGCGDADVSSCVGGYDPYCTATRWDSLCAQEVEHLGCGLCR